ncbi:type II toxin-antitoxin system VapC family toxin [Desulfonema limicola]|uniref:type II toxin-antitoxin system VapC family toxin n=1 Tax=Desulfonema limicola TaxID=45656 RepID=UPI001A9A780A|nr:type II toxin-antitoxin system VapC family toxin [Desulfonema limicola]
MNGDYLLDTNIVIGLFANDSKIIDKITNSKNIAVPCIVIGELCYGANKSVKSRENLLRIEDFAQNNIVLNCDEITAKYYGSVKDRLRLKGRPIPENDIWIAAIALQYDMTLITRDEHFKEVEKLKIEKW